jgi:hypothetical protein
VNTGQAEDGELDLMMLIGGAEERAAQTLHIYPEDGKCNIYLILTSL